MIKPGTPGPDQLPGNKPGTPGPDQVQNQFYRYKPGLKRINPGLQIVFKTWPEIENTAASL